MTKNKITRDYLIENPNRYKKEVLIELPCNIGDIVYFLSTKIETQRREPVLIEYVEKGEVDKIIIGRMMIPQIIIYYDDNIKDTYSAAEFGENIFLTREEAEEALKKMKKITKEETIEKHRKMWRWLAANPDKTKEDYVKEFNLKDISQFSNYCYLCDYILRRGLPCEECLLDWQDTCVRGKGLYFEWMSAEGECRAQIAKTIAELPARG